MPSITRSAAEKLMDAIGFKSANVLSTHRLEKKINRLPINSGPNNREKFDEPTEQDDIDLLDFIFEAVNSGEKIEVKDDREGFPKIARERKPGKIKRKGVREFTGRKNKYDWNEILNGEINMLEQGTDYDCSSTTFAVQVRAAAKRRGQKVQVKVSKGQVVVQADSGS